MTHFFCRDAGWCHAVIVLDCWNREVIGYRVSRNQNAQVAVGALEDALIHRFHGRKDLSGGVILRSDNGLIFSSKAFFAVGERPWHEDRVHHAVYPGAEWGC